MKNLIKHFPCLLFLVVISTFVFSCKKSELGTENDPIIMNPNDPNDPGDPSDPIDPDAANEIAASLISQTGTSFTANIPPNSMTGSLRLDRNQIVLVDGLLPFVGIIKPSGMILQIAHVQVAGSETVLEVEFEELESDTVVYLNLEFDETDWELPITFDIDIAPLDGSGTPVDVITVPVIVEEVIDQGTQGTGCTIDAFVGEGNAQVYKWLVTYTKSLADNPSAITSFNGFEELGINPNEVGGYAAGQEIIHVLSVNGCCTSSGSIYGDCIGLPTHAIVAADQKSVYNGAELVFFRDQTVIGSLTNKLTQNVAPLDFDYCNGVPAYMVSSIDNYYEGTYTLNSSTCSVTIDSFTGQTEPVYSNGQYIGEWPLLIYSGSGGSTTYTKYSESVLIERNNNSESGGIHTTKIYYVE